MFERFTDRARQVLVLAQEEARLLDHGFIGTEHILLGLLQEGEGLAAQALDSFGISIESVREKVLETVGVDGNTPSGSPPFTPRAKTVLELSLRESLQLGHSYIDTEHILLGLLREGDGVGATVLVSLGADLGGVRREVLGLMPEAADREGGATERRKIFGRKILGRRQPLAVAPSPPPRCALCGRDLSETAHVVVGGHGRACEDCIRAAAGLLDRAVPEQGALLLPPRVFGQPPDERAVEGVVAAVEGTFGPSAGPDTWRTAVEEAERFGEALTLARRQWGGPKETMVSEVRFLTADLAEFRGHVDLLLGSRGMVMNGQVRREGERWVVTAETVAAVLRRMGVDVPPAGT